jgi:tetratricopeptide (TPR) repeat protein
MKNLTQEQINKVVALYNNGKFQDAIESIKLLNVDYPNVPLLFNLIGACYKSIGQIDAALKMFKTATEIKPDYAEAYFNQGVVCQEINKANEAIRLFKKALGINSNYPDAYNNLGIIYRNLDQIDNAIESFEWAIAYKNDFAEAHNNLGACWQDIDKLEAALKSYKEAIRIKPNYAQAHNNLGILFQKIGQIDDASQSFETALIINPSFASAHYNLSALKKYKSKDKQIIQMSDLLNSNNLNSTNRIFLNFALAKANEDIGMIDKMFNFLDEGNKLRKKQLNFSFDSSMDGNNIIKKLFKSQPISINEITNNDLQKRPIFILGMPRSGTSLVEQIISSHPEVFGAGELKNLSKIIIQLIHESNSFSDIELNELSILSIRQKYMKSIEGLNINEIFFTDKWPLNFRNIGFILSAFPEAKIVHLKRDARAICWSIYKHYFGDSGNGWAYNLSDIAEYYLLYKDLMDYWHKLYPNKIYDLCYEDLTINQEEETRKLLNYCDLNWDENCLNFHTSNRAVKTASSVQVRQKMYQGSSDAWKKYEAYLKVLVKDLKFY